MIRRLAGELKESGAVLYQLLGYSECYRSFSLFVQLSLIKVEIDHIFELQFSFNYKVVLVNDDIRFESILS